VGGGVDADGVDGRADDVAVFEQEFGRGSTEGGKAQVSVASRPRNAFGSWTRLCQPESMMTRARSGMRLYRCS
jgi:hypothetical protein